MHLTDAERLILANQYRIMAKLEDNARYALLSESLKDGHKYLYDQRLNGSVNPVLPQEDEDLVLDILLIYSCLNESYALLEDTSGIDPALLVFPGFDGENEPRLLLFARDLVKHDQFPEVLGDGNKDSLRPTMAMYRRMIRCWGALGEPTHPFDRETILQILAVMPAHPDDPA